MFNSFYKLSLSFHPIKNILNFVQGLLCNTYGQNEHVPKIHLMMIGKNNEQNSSGINEEK